MTASVIMLGLGDHTVDGSKLGWSVFNHLFMLCSIFLPSSLLERNNFEWKILTVRASNGALSVYWRWSLEVPKSLYCTFAYGYHIGSSEPPLRVSTLRKFLSLLGLSNVTCPCSIKASSKIIETGLLYLFIKL